MHSIANNKVVMTMQERILIMNSSICDEKGNLKRVLKCFDKSIREKDLQKIKDIDFEVFQLIKTRDAIEEIENNMSTEWKPTRYNGIIKEPCQLCGNRKSEEKFTIRNKSNHNELLVGTRCIHRFDNLEDKLSGIPVDQYAKYAKTSPQKLKRIIYFNSICPDGKSIFLIWKHKYEKFDILFPKNYDIEFSNILKLSKRIYNSYINGKIPQKQVNTFKKWVNEFNYFYKKCEQFYNTHKDDKYVCTRKIADFLLKSKLNTTLEYIQRTGEIKKEVAPYVYHIDFIKRFKKDIEKVFLQYKIILKGINNNYVIFSYEYKQFAAVFLEVSLKNFTRQFYSIFYGNVQYDEYNLFSELNVCNDYDSVYNFIGILNGLLKHSQYKFYINNELYNKQVMELQNKNTEQYTNIELNNFLKKHMYVFYMNENSARIKMLSYIKKVKGWKDQMDKDKYDIGDISSEWSVN
ncbi:hypothetical protein WX45_01945 [Clostridium ljungdahlii DSM 13528]|uniref:Uncharacterized protein n=1 Tax=Clostridium ljungdahlii (strain ATCC 55383 / DSM 13528 / PETC) TaxID=748727 RepID=A0ABX2TNW7_CLOLD|nr:hypothetical protein WX45_01945 [Clostridium ljungdahlii DSM 13528]